MNQRRDFTKILLNLYILIVVFTLKEGATDQDNEQGFKPASILTIC